MTQNCPKISKIPCTPTFFGGQKILVSLHWPHPPPSNPVSWVLPVHTPCRGDWIFCSLWCANDMTCLLTNLRKESISNAFIHDSKLCCLLHYHGNGVFLLIEEVTTQPFSTSRRQSDDLLLKKDPQAAAHATFLKHSSLVHSLSSLLDSSYSSYPRAV